MKYDKLKRLVARAEDCIFFRQEGEHLEVRIRSGSEVWQFFLPNLAPAYREGILVERYQLADALNLISETRESVKDAEVSIELNDGFLTLKEEVTGNIAMPSFEGDRFRFHIFKEEEPWKFHLPQNRWEQIVCVCRATDNEVYPEIFFKHSTFLSVTGVSKWAIATASIQQNNRCQNMRPTKFSLAREVVLAYQNLFMPEEVEISFGEENLYLSSPKGTMMCPIGIEKSPLAGKRLLFPEGASAIVGTVEIKDALKKVSETATVTKPDEDFVSLIWKPESKRLEIEGSKARKQISYEIGRHSTNSEVPSSVTVPGRVLYKTLVQVKSQKLTIHLPKKDRWEMLTLYGGENSISLWLMPVRATSAQVADLGHLYLEEARLGKSTGSHVEREFLLWSQVETEEVGLERARKLAQVALEFLQYQIESQEDPSEGLLENKERLTALLAGEEDPAKLAIAASRVMSLRRHTQYRRLELE